MAIEPERIHGAGGVVFERSYRPCALPPRREAPGDRIDRTAATAPAFAPPNLRAIEGPGGHTLRRHAGVPDADVRARAVRMGHDASSFRDEASAQAAVDRAFAQNQDRIAAWLGRGSRGNLRLDVHMDAPAGRIFRYERGAFEETSNACTILKRAPGNPGFTVITAYPT